MVAKDHEHVTVKWLVIGSDLHSRENMATGHRPPGGYSIAIYKCRISCVLIRMAGIAVQNLFMNKIGSPNK